MKPSKRLVDSPAVIIDAENLTASMRRIMRGMKKDVQLPVAKQNLEINPRHNIIVRLDKMRGLPRMFNDFGGSSALCRKGSDSEMEKPGATTRHLLQSGALAAIALLSDRALLSPGQHGKLIPWADQPPPVPPPAQGCDQEPDALGGPRFLDHAE